MEKINQKIAYLKTNGYELQFENVFNKAFENYKKIALYAGLAILVFGFIFMVLAAIGLISFVGVEHLNENTIKQLESKMLQPEYIGYQFIGVLIFSCLFSPISAGFLKMAEAGNKDVEFKISEFFYYYKWLYFKELMLATFIITAVNTGISSLLTYYKIPFLGGFLSFIIGLFTVFTIPLILFGKQKAIAAISSSLHLSGKQVFVIFLLVFVAFIGSLVGLLGFCIGVLFTIPFNISMQYAIYETVIGIKKDEVVVLESEEN